MKLRNILALLVICGQYAAMPFAIAADASSQGAQGSVSGFVVPSEVKEKEAFTVAATNVLEGEVIAVQTVEGEVVARKKPDQLGRIFLAAGLASGLYLLTREGGGGGGGGQPKPVPCPIEIKPNPNPGNIPSGPLNFAEPPKFSNLKDGLSLKGSGINPNAALNSLSSGSTGLPVLAATASEMKTGPLPNFEPGSYDLKAKNLETGQEAAADGLVFYDCQSKLTRTKVGNNELTQIEFALRPDYVEAQALVEVTAGPVHLGGGETSKHVVLRAPVTMVPVLANPTGSGTFNVAWSVTTVMMLEPQQAPKKPCDAEEHRLEWDGAWQRGTDGKKFTAWRRLRCQVHFGCSKLKGHAGAHAFTKKKRCDSKEKFTDSNGNGVWDENDGPWTDDGDGKPEPGEYGDANGDGNYDPPEKFEDKNKNGSYDGDKSETNYFDTKEARDKFIKDNSE